MKAADRIRRKIEATKRQSFFNLIPVEDSAVPTSAKPSERKRTADSDSNFTLFPLLDCTQPLSDRRGNLEHEKTDPFQSNGHEERSFLREKKAMLQTTPDRFRKNRRIYFETVANVTELKAKSLAPTLRINRPSKKRNTHEIRAKRVDLFASTDSTSVVVETAQQKPNPERRLSVRRNVRPALRGRRISPRKSLSPLSPMRKFSISAWETGEEQKSEMP